MSEERPEVVTPRSPVPDGGAGSGPPAPPADTPPAPVNVTRLIHEAATKSGLLWVRLPDGGTHPV